jgi:FkbM family methyltransferase
MKLFELIRLVYRALKYKYRNDPGGIDFLLETVHSGDTVFDIGAHKAGYLYFMTKRVGVTGKVFAFEPQVALYQYIVSLSKLIGWNNTTIEHLALSDQPGLVTLYIPSSGQHSGSSPGASLIEHDYPGGVGSTEEVNTITLDAYCKQHNIRPDFLKIDVEGNEQRIFEGGINTLRACNPKILVEIEARHIGREQALMTIDYLQKLGYSGYFIQGKTRIPVASFDFDIYQNPATPKMYCNNFIFV